MKDLYTLLEVPKDASTEVIKKNFRALAVKYHPDRGGSNTRMVELNEAYAVLVDEKRRALYDKYGERSLSSFFDPSKKESESQYQPRKETHRTRESTYEHSRRTEREYGPPWPHSYGTEYSYEAPRPVRNPYERSSYAAPQNSNARWVGVVPTGTISYDVLADEFVVR